jgi:ADP-ribose pyrophosphatase YjhB (NUDIX family)
MKRNERREIEVIARGACVVGGRLLLCHSKGARNDFLPGGHVEFGEAARDALVREVREELGRSARAGRFLGSVEHRFEASDGPHSEVNLVFELRIPGLKAGARPMSAEEKIAFRWMPLGALRRSRLEPSPLRRVLPAWRRAAGWASTCEAPARGRRRGASGRR